MFYCSHLVCELNLFVTVTLTRKYSSTYAYVLVPLVKSDFRESDFREGTPNHSGSSFVINLEYV
jgi:hypothetical protein